MANQQNSYTGSQGTGTNSADFSFTFPSFTTGEVKVEVDNVVKTLTTHYTVENYNTTSGGTVRFTTGNIPTGTTPVRIFRQTNVDSPKAEFQAGSSLKAGEINDNFKQVRHALQEAIGALATDRKVQRFNIEADAIDGTLIADDVVNSEHYVAGSIDHEHLANDIIDGDNIQDDVINSEHYVASSIDEEHLANSAVTQNKLANNSVGSPELINGSVITDKIAADNVTMDKLGSGALPTDITVASANIVNGTITTADIGGDQITNALIADNQIDSEHYIDGSIDHVHLANDCVDEDNIQDDAVRSEHILANAVTDSEIATGTLDNRYYTETELLTDGVLDARYFTESESDARYFNISTGDTIKDGDTFPDNDTTIATTAAINDRIIDLVDDVGGFVPIANETSFPTANPDINNPPAGGTIVSIKTISSTRTPSNGTVTIANGAGTGNTVTITGCGSTVLTAGFGILVETTSTLHTYAFHRLVPKATEVTTVAGISSNITTVANNTANINAVAADASDIGIVAADGTDIGLVAGSIANVNTTAGSIANVNTTAGSITNVNNVGNNISNVNSVAGNESNINSAVSNASNINSAVSNASNINTVAGSISNVNTTAGSISNVNTVASNISSVNSFANTYRIGSNNPQTSLDVGDLFFNTQSNSLKVYTGSAWVDGVTATGNFALKTGNTFTGSNIYNDNVKALFGTGSDFEIYHTGSNGFIDNKTGDLYLRNTVTNGDCIIQAAAGGHVYLRPNAGENGIIANTNGAVELYYDNSKKFETTSTGASVSGTLAVNSNILPNGYIKVLNDQPVYFGTNNQLNIVGTATDAQIVTDGTVDLIIKDANHTSAIFDTSAEVQLYYDNSKKLETQTNGVTVQGSVFALGTTPQLRLNSDTSDGSTTRAMFGMATTANNFVNGSEVNDVVLNCPKDFVISHGSTELMAKFKDDSSVELYCDSSKKLETTSGGVLVTGDVDSTTGIFERTTGFTSQLKFTDSNETKLVHGSNGQVKLSFVGVGNAARGSIDGQSGFIRMITATGDTGVICRDNSSTDLRFDDSTKLETTSSGVDITGGINATGLSTFSASGSAVRLNDGSIQRYGNADADYFQYYDGSGDIAYLSVGTSRTLRITTDDFNVYGAGNTEQIIRGQKDGAVTLFYDNGAKLATYQYGVSVTGNVQIGTHAYWNDNGEAIFGTSSDFKIYHDGNDTWLLNQLNKTGSLYLRNRVLNEHTYVMAGAGGNVYLRVNDGEEGVVVTHNAGVGLYYDNSKKLETTSTGVDITGNLHVDALPDTTTNSYLKIAIQDTDGTLKSDDTIKINPAQNAMSVNGLFLNSNTCRASGNGPLNLTTANASGTVDLSVKTTHVECNGDLLPATDSTDDLGSNTVRWANVYADTLYGDGSNLSGIAAFPSGTKMLFAQSAAPTGWTHDTSYNNRALKLVSDSSGGSTGGSNTWSSVLNSSVNTSGGSVSNHTLTTSQMPSHNHSMQQRNAGLGCGSNIPQAGIPGTFGCNNNSTSFSTNNTGGGSSHNHGFTNPSFNLNLRYLNVIVATKD